MRKFGAILGTELRLALRNADMLIFGIAFPLGLAILLGFISTPEALKLDLAGLVSVAVCASGLMGLPLTFSDYRHRKILKRMRVTPASPALLLGAQAFVQLLWALVSAALVLLVTALGFGVRVDGGAARFAATFLFVLASVYSLGFLVASLAPNLKSANAWASILYFPMLMLSGATIPFEIFPKGLRAFAEVFPLTQGVKLLKGAVMGYPISGLMAPLIALSLLAVAAYAVSLKSFRWE